VKVRERLGSDSEELDDEPCFRNNVALCYPSDSALTDHVQGFYSFESSPGTLKRAIAFCQPGPLLYGSMVLFNDVVEILALAQTNSAGESALGLQGFHCRRIGRVLIHIDDPRNGIGGRAKYFLKEAFSCSGVAFRRQQKIDGLPGRIHSPVQILVLPLNLI
jgi:hypothetical protein